jgi:hypothetical protein
VEKGSAIAVGLLVALLGAPGAGAREKAADTIFVRLRHSYPICAGFCPNFEMKVSPSGKVVSRDLWRRKVRRFRATPEGLAAFQRQLATIRPPAERRLDESCTRFLDADGKPDMWDDPRPDDIEVRWRGKGGSSRLTSCGYTHRDMRDTVEQAVRALGADLLWGGKARPIEP